MPDIDPDSTVVEHEAELVTMMHQHRTLNVKGDTVTRSEPIPESGIISESKLIAENRDTPFPDQEIAYDFEKGIVLGEYDITSLPEDKEDEIA